MSKQKERETKAQNGKEGILKAERKKEKEMKKYREVLVKTNTRCSKVHVSLKKSLKAVQTQYGLQVQAGMESRKLCAEEKQQERVVKERKAKVAAGADKTFEWNDKHGCKAGSGSFTKKLKQDDRVVVGTIPAGVTDAWVKLRTDKDVDTELWDKSKKYNEKEVAIVAWRTGKINSATQASIKYAGAKVTYSGYNGIASKDGTLNFGHEDIRLTGTSDVDLEMRAFGFDAGTAKIKYSWGQNPKKCAAHKAAVRKEKRDKFNLRQQLKKKLRESEYKAAVKALQGSTKGCKGASKWLAVVKLMLSKRKLGLKKLAKPEKKKEISPKERTAKYRL